MAILQTKYKKARRKHFVKTYGKGKKYEENQPEGLAMCSLTGCGKPSTAQIHKRTATPSPTEVTCPHCLKKINALEETKCLARLMITK
jgi:hypothetical protein